MERIGERLIEASSSQAVARDLRRRLRLKRQGQKRPLTQMIGDGELPVDVR